MGRRDFVVYCDLLSQITVKDLQEASEQELHGERICNGGVSQLMKHIQVTCSHIMGTDSS